MKRSNTVKILVIGNMGYIGPCVVEQLRKSYTNYEIIGYDIGYFAHCLTGVSVLPECFVDQQYFGDVRNFPAEFLEDVASVVYLAAISNDPMGNLFEQPTYQINYKSACNVALKAKKAGVKSFIFASSCSMYGVDSDLPRTEKDHLNPLTAYAQSKVLAENKLRSLADESYVCTSLRFSTACGMSPRLRLDLVLNDFIANAVVNKKIVVLSDGTPRRPLIHIKDMARAIDWSVARKADEGGNFLALNVGRNDWNYQIKDLAEAAADIIQGIEININKNGQPDKRSYQVSFELFKNLAPDYQPLYSLEQTIKELWEGLEKMGFSTVDFRNTWYMRLKVLEDHIANHRLDKDLRWIE